MLASLLLLNFSAVKRLIIVFIPRLTDMKEFSYVGFATAAKIFCICFLFVRASQYLTKNERFHFFPFIRMQPDE